MRILIVNDQHWPMKSGVATAARTLARGLAARGHQVMVLAPSQTRRSYRETDGNYIIERIRSVGLPFRRNLRVSVTYTREVAGIIRDFGPDVVHVHTQLTVGLTALRVALQEGIPVVATNHVMPDNIIKNLRILSPVSRPLSYIISEFGILLYKGADQIIMPTESALELFNLDRIGAPAVAISNGIDLKRFTPSPARPETYKKFDLPKNKPIISYLGRLDAEKHIDIIIEAFANIRNEGYDAHLLIVGTGNIGTTLKVLAEEIGIAEHTTFTGLVSDEDLVQLHRVGSLYAMPSPNELQSLAMLEAMASGKPVVAVDAGALGELCRNGENGYLVEVDDIAGFTDAFRELIDNSARREAFGNRSREIARLHDEAIVIPKFISLYEEVTSRHPLGKTV